jgi:hypothetical protein
MLCGAGATDVWKGKVRKMGIGGALEGVAGAHIQNSSCPTVDSVTAADGTIEYALPHYVLFTTRSRPPV